MMPRTNHFNYAIQMQINDNHDLPQILFSQDQDLNTRSLNLKPGHVYEIEVSADGQVSTSGFKKLSLEVRNCRLEDEVEKGSLFKLYSQHLFDEKLKILYGERMICIFANKAVYFRRFA